MSKNIITKLPSSVDNDNLPYYGMLKVHIRRSRNIDNYNREIKVQTVNNKIFAKGLNEAKLSGFYFDIRQKTIQFSGQDVLESDEINTLFLQGDMPTADEDIILVGNKYDFTFLGSASEWHSGDIRFDLDDLKYCTNLKEIYFPNAGDIATGSLKNIPDSVTSLVLQHAGDVGDITHLTKLTKLEMYVNYSIFGDISALSSLTGLTELKLNETAVTGDISALSSLTGLTELHIDRTKISGDISKAPLAKLTSLGVPAAVTGDISTIIDGCPSLTSLTIVNKTSSGALTYTDEQLTTLKNNGVTITILS